MIIDCHAHYLPQRVLDEIAAGAHAFASVRAIVEDGGTRFQFADRAPTRPVMGRLRETAERAAWMAKQGIEIQLVGGWLDAFGYELPADEGADWSRWLNEVALATCAGEPALRPLATVPLQSGRHSAEVLREARDAGFAGLMIGTQPHGDRGGLDDPMLDEFWSAAADTGLPVFIHPMFGSDDLRLHDMGMMNAVGRVTDTTIAVSRLLLAGHMQRFAGLKLVIATGGAALPFMLGRLARNREVMGDALADPVEGFHALYFDSLVFRVDALHFLCDLVGTDRVLMGSDWPFPIGDPRPCRVIEASKYDAAAKAAMLGGNAEFLFALAP